MKLTVALTALAMAGSATFTQGPGRASAHATWMVVEHEVADFDHWQEKFRAALPIRRGVGELSHDIYRDLSVPSRVTVVMKWDNDARARSFAQDPILANGMRAAGVIGGVWIWICGTAMAPTDASTSPACDMIVTPSLSIGTAEATSMR